MLFMSSSSRRRAGADPPGVSSHAIASPSPRDDKNAKAKEGSRDGGSVFYNLVLLFLLALIVGKISNGEIKAQRLKVEGLKEKAINVKRQATNVTLELKNRAVNYANDNQLQEKALQLKNGLTEKAENLTTQILNSASAMVNFSQFQTSSGDPSTQDVSADLTTMYLRKKDDLVMVINTNFQIGQSNLVHLGTAAVYQLRSVLLPSLRKQTTSNFLLVVHTDAELDKTLIERLRSALKGMKNAVVVASGANKPPDIRDKYYENLEESDVLAGSYDLLKGYHEASKSTRLVLHSHVETHQSIYFGFVENLQKQVLADWKNIKNSSFRFLCAEKLMSWQYFDTWDKTSTAGYLSARDLPSVCVSAGLTKVFTSDYKAESLPTVEISKIHSEIPTCRKPTQTECLQRIKTASRFSYPVFQLTGSIPSKKKEKTWHKKQDELWKAVLHDFDVQKDSLTSYRSKFVEMASDMLTESCLGKNCKRESSMNEKQKFLKYVEKNG